MNINIRHAVTVKNLPYDLVHGQPDRLRPLALKRPGAGAEADCMPSATSCSLGTRSSRSPRDVDRDL